jgi:hypothetical protein
MPIYSLVSLLFFSIAAAAPAPSIREVLSLAGIPAHKISRLEEGEIITHNIQEATDKEIAMSVAMYLAVPPVKIVDYMRTVELFAIDADVTAYGSIPNNANSSDFKRFAFSESQIDEAIDLLNMEDTDNFNLSSQEISSFLTLQNTLANADKNTLLKKVSQKYREILQQRWQAYRTSGLKGIAPYTRDEGVVSPATELTISVETCKALSHYFPELFHGWMNFPVSLPLGAEEHFHWINRMVENRPTAILAHSVLQMTHYGAVILGRQFYVGHSYNSSHVCVGILPYREGTLVYYIESSSTDQVAGIAGGLRHVVGRAQLKEQMIKHMEKLSKTFETVPKAN